MASSSNRQQFARALLGSAALIAVVVSADAAAQNAPADAASSNDIIVTARKRSESLIAVPVAIAAVGAEELSRSGINGVDGLARKVPGFIVGEGGGTIQGGSISLRGISAADSNPLGDQAVSFNIDGVQVARASIRRMGDFDVAQVDVMKGPQALFYGKNSPGGIISMRTNDPTDRFEAGGKLGYEVVGHEWRGEGYVSGPLTDGLGARLAFYGSDMRGWVKNALPDGTQFKPRDPYGPENKEYALRGTLKYDQGGPFTARFKLSYNRAKGQGFAANYQFVDCPAGVAQGAPFDDCKANNRITTASLGPDFAKLPSTINMGGILSPSDYGDGEGYNRQSQWLSGLELTYRISDEVKITSVTGYYDLDLINRSNFNAASIPSFILGSIQALKIREWSQELRLETDIDGPINFMAGGQFQKSQAESASLAAFGAIAGQPSLFGAARPSPFPAAQYYLKQKGHAYSVFAQLQFKPIEQLEISAGGRLSSETKRLTSVINFNHELIGAVPSLSNGRNKRDFDDFSPEVTVSYRPTNNFTAYVTYKQGFLSGGFNGGSFNANGDLSYRPQRVEGWEAGVKARTANGRLSAELALYDYKINDLQVQITTQGTIQELRNAGKVSSKGAEFSLNYRPPLDGLSLYGNVAYQKGRYDEYYATCYAGQAFLRPGTGIGQCAQQPNPNNSNIVGLLQNLSGTELVRSPEWTGNAGFIFDTPVSSNMKLELSSGVNYSTSYITSPVSQPRARQPKFATVDATLRLVQVDDKWEFAIIGTNLTNKYTFVRGIDTPSAAIQPTRLADTIAVVSRGRQVMFRAGFKY